MATPIKPVAVTPKNPLEILNFTVARAKAKADVKGIQLREQRAAFERKGFTAPDGENPAALASAQSAHESERQRLQSLERNYRPSIEVMTVLDDDANSPSMLAGALRHLRQLADATPKPPKAEMVVAAHSLPVGGLFGVPEAIDIDAELSGLEAAVKAFPDREPFERLVGRFNKIASELSSRAEKAKPTPPEKRMDRGWIVKERASSSEPITRTQASPLPTPTASNQSAPRRASAIVGA